MVHLWLIGLALFGLAKIANWLRRVEPGWIQNLRRLRTLEWIHSVCGKPVMQFAKVARPSALEITRKMRVPHI
jgi:hypothetical protein